MKTVSVVTAKRLGITSCTGDKSLFDVAQIMNNEDISSVVIVDDEGYLEGIITRTDIVRAALAHPDDWYDRSCRKWMTKEVITVDQTTSLQSAAHILQSQHIHRVVVVERIADRLRPLAVISDGDIVYQLVKRGLSGLPT